MITPSFPHPAPSHHTLTSLSPHPPMPHSFTHAAASHHTLTSITTPKPSCTLAPQPDKQHSPMLHPPSLVSHPKTSGHAITSHSHVASSKGAPLSAPSHATPAPSRHTLGNTHHMLVTKTRQPLHQLTTGSSSPVGAGPGVVRSGASCIHSALCHLHALYPVSLTCTLSRHHTNCVMSIDITHEERGEGRERDGSVDRTG